MHPTIREGEAITVATVASAEVKRGDILLCRGGRGVIAHRVVGIQRKKSGATARSSALSHHYWFVLRGDASSTCDEPVEARQVLGRVVSVEREGRCIDLASTRVKMLHVMRVCASRLKAWISPGVRPIEGHR